MKKCPYCGCSNDDDAKTCKQCYADISATVKQRNQQRNAEKTDKE